MKPTSPTCSASFLPDFTARSPEHVTIGARREAGLFIPMSKKNIEDCVRETLTQYFKDLDGAEPHSLHDMVILSRWLDTEA